MKPCWVRYFSGIFISFKQFMCKYIITLLLMIIPYAYSNPSPGECLAKYIGYMPEQQIGDIYRDVSLTIGSWLGKGSGSEHSVCTATRAQDIYNGWGWMAWIEKARIPYNPDLMLQLSNCANMINSHMFFWKAKGPLDNDIKIPSRFDDNNNGRNYITGYCIGSWQSDLQQPVRIWNSIQSDYKADYRFLIKIHVKIDGQGVCMDSQNIEQDCFMVSPALSYQYANNGQYLLDYPKEVTILFEELYTTEELKMASCAPGTWMTCIGAKSCSYVVPLTSAKWESIDDGVIYKNTGYIPVNGCYPCEAGYDKIHYDFLNNIICPSSYSLSDISMYSTCKSAPSSLVDLGKVWCPGGTFPPMRCPPGLSASDDYTACYCDAGTYLSNGSTCVTCPTGHYCVNGVKNVCPDGTYQSQVGQFQCQACEVEGRPVRTCEAGSNTQPAKCFSRYGILFVTIPQCVACSLCLNSIINQYDNGDSYIECYN